jgi:Ala-tRNA(Pro) deacylase
MRGKERHMTIALTLQRYLDGKSISYDVLKHQRTSTSARSAEASHIPGGSLAKGVLLRGETDYLLAVVPASSRVRLDDVARLINQTVAMATEGEIEALFADCDIGAVPPVGSAYGLKTVIDESLDGLSDVYIEGGDHESLIHMTKQQFGSLMEEAARGRIANHL